MSTDLTQCEKSGVEVSIYYDTADNPSIAGGSSCTTPTWVFHKGITGDITITETEGEEELSSRDPSLKYRQYSESRADLEVSGEQMVDTLYEGFIFINSMRAGSYARNMLVLTGYLSDLNNVGFRGKWRNFDRTISGPETGPQKQTFKLKPASCVKSGCYITNVKTGVANSTVAYDPGIFAEYDAEALARSILNHDIYRGMTNTTAEEVFTDVGPVITWLGVEETDKLLVSLVESQPIVMETNPNSARRFGHKVQGIGGFNREALVKVLNEIIGNSLGEKYIKS
jgi:hypothetical protein